MMSHWLRSSAAIAVVLGLAWLPSLAWAESTEVRDKLRAMQSRMQQMEDQIQAASDQLDSANHRVEEQAQVIEQAGLKETRGSTSGLPGFLGEITIGGWVQASYFYNVNDPQDHNRCDGLGPDSTCVFSDEELFTTTGEPIGTVGEATGFNSAFGQGGGGLGGTNAGMNDAFYPYTPDHNSFALDQVWFELERPIDEENRAGFRFDSVYGKTAALIGGPSNRFDGLRDDTALYIFAGYVQYLAPIGDGLTFKAGKFGTPIGNEYAQAIYNWNITNSSVFNLLEPLDHNGITAEYSFGDTGFDAMVGGVNGFFPDDPDRNDAKSVIGHVGWENDKISFGVNGIYGAENQGDDGGQTGVVNGVLNVELSDRLAFWINGDYDWAKDSDQAAWGVASAVKFGITDRTAISLRGEYVADVDGFLGFQGLSFAGVTANNQGVEGLFPTGIEVWGITATVSHLLTDHLQIRAEARYDNIDKDSTDNDDFFQDSVGNFDNDQIVVGADVIYNFNKFGGE